MAKGSTPPPDLYVRADLPPEYTKAHVVAMQALVQGKANEGQQTMALDWIIRQAGMAYDQSYRGPGRAEDSAFAEGRRFVANQVIKLTKLNVANLKD